MSVRSRVYRERRLPAERPAAAIVAGLWRNGEQGAWYDPSDISTMFQDVVGGVPVYMPGQGQPDCWIGLQLDKRFGLARGPERLTNGDISGGGASWAVTGSDATHIVTFAGGVLRYQSDTTSPALTVSQVGVMTAGKWYEVTIVVSAHAGGSLKTDNLQAGGAGFTIANGPGTYKTIGIAVGTGFAFTRGSGNVDITIDSISVRELLGNHRWQGTATSRPVLSARYNVLTRTEDFTNAVWLKRFAGTGAAPVVTENYAISPRGDLTADRIVFLRGSGTASGDYSLIGNSASFSAPTRTIRSVWMKSNTGADQNVVIYDGAQNAGAAVTVTPEWRQFFLTGGAAATLSSIDVGSRGGGTWFSNNQANLDICVWGADIRPENDGVGLPPYQRVVDASTYDTVGFPLYRKPDGVDDWMQTAAVDFSGTGKVTVATAMRKLSDAARAMLIELGTAAENTVGNFAVEAPSAGLQNLAARASGSSSENTMQTASAIAPLSAVLLARIDSAAGVGIRINGGAWAENKTPFGGNFVNAPVYFDRRTGASLPSSARDYGTLIVGRLLTGPETAAVEKFLRQKSRAY